MTVDLLHVLRKLRMTLVTGMSIIIISLFVSGLTGCSSNDNTPSVNEVIITSNSTFGNILTDGRGNALYFFARDVKGTSSCASGTCAANWPSYYETGLITGDGLNASDFSVITHDDGTMQNTYKGWPLYYYSGDTKPGDVNGDGVGNSWYVAKPDYSLMVAVEQLVGADGKSYTGDYVEGTGETMFLTDSAGFVLYLFKKDSANQNNFTKQDFSNNDFWPIFYTELESVPSLISKSDFGEIDVYGQTQMVYKGWPLYYFGQDGARGDTKGVSVPQPGIWPVVNKDTPEAP